jgi:phosphoglycolate phosphatase-like HAD superfamily hydrolase
MGKIKAIISDADGTLVNTLYMIRRGQYEAAAEYLAENGMPRHEFPPYEVYEKRINEVVGGSTTDTLQKTLRLLFGETHQPHLDRIDYDELDKLLDVVQDHLAPLYVHPYHGLTELLSWCGMHTISFGIFTSGSPHHVVRNFGVSLPAVGYTKLFRNRHTGDIEKLRSFIMRTKAVFGLPELAIVTCNDVATTKPDPESLLRLMDSLHVGPDELLVLGDHAVDMKAAEAAEAHAIGVSHGFGTSAELKEAGAARVIEDLSALPGIITAHNEGKSKLF